MGHNIHHAIVVTTWDSKRLDEAVQAARDVGDVKVIAQADESINGYRTLLICPDGSKSGWDADFEGDTRRDDFIRWLRSQRDEDGGNCFEWVEVQYGRDDEAAIITRHEWDALRAPAPARKEME